MTEQDDDAWLNEVEHDLSGLAGSDEPEVRVDDVRFSDDVATMDQPVGDEVEDLADFDVDDSAPKTTSFEGPVAAIRSVWAPEFGDSMDSKAESEAAALIDERAVLPLPIVEPPPIRKIMIDDDSMAAARSTLPVGSSIDSLAPRLPPDELSRAERRAAKKAAKQEDKTEKKSPKVPRKAAKPAKDDTATFAAPAKTPGSADGAKVRKVLIAEDDEPLDLSSLPPATKVDPRVRKRRIEVKRAAGRRRFRWFIVAGIGALVLLAGLVVLASPMFSVKRIDVVGAAYTTPEQLAPLLDEINGEPILTVDPKKLEDKIETLPWVRRAEVDIGFPRTVTIRISERQPAASYRGIDGRWRIVDRTARVIAIETGQPADFLPVSGAGPDLEPGETAGPAIATLAELAEVIGKLPELDAIVIGLSAQGTDLRMTMMSPGGTGVEVVFGTSSQLRTKLSALLSLLERDDFSLDDYVQINLTDPSKPALG